MDDQRTQTQDHFCLIWLQHVAAPKHHFTFLWFSCCQDTKESRTCCETCRLDNVPFIPRRFGHWDPSKSSQSSKMWKPGRFFHDEIPQYLSEIQLDQLVFEMVPKNKRFHVRHVDPRVPGLLLLMAWFRK